MEAQDENHPAADIDLDQHSNGDAGEVETMSSPETTTSNTRSKLQLPVSVDPPTSTNPTKQLVWIVSIFR